MNSVTRLDSIEAYDGEVYYKKSFLLDDDQKMDYSKLKQLVKKRVCNNEALPRVLKESNLRLINNESKIHYQYTEENSKKFQNLPLKNLIAYQKMTDS